MKTKSCKAKARRLQRWVKETILRLDLQQQPDYPLKETDIKVAIMGESGADVIVYPWDFYIECKAHEGLKKIYDFCEQAEANAKGKYWAVIVKSNNKPPLAIVKAEEVLV